MNIQRKYSLPNCTLLLEGLNDAKRAAHYQDMRPELSILVNAQCYLSGYNTPLMGGREFFESLIRAVSAYAQEFLSSVASPIAENSESELVQLQKIDSNRHRLIVQSEFAQQGLEPNHNSGKAPIQIDLNTVQLFDLVEAVDQFFADTQTLPELSLQLQPGARRYGGTSQALLKQAVPASVGVSSLAAAALACGLIPVPEVRSPQPETRENVRSTTKSVNSSAAGVAVPTPSANEQIAPTPTFTPNPIPSTSSVVSDLETLLNTVPEITDPSQLRALNRQVYNQVNPAWKNRSGLNQDLVYRLGVAADGAIIGYKAVNKQANEAVEQTPLSGLLYNPASRGPVTTEPIAQYKVVFTKAGVLEVSPWRGYARTPDVIGEKIADPNTVKDLNGKLYDTIRKNGGSTHSFSRDLKYRVAVNKDGMIADYEPLNQVAFDYARETPLPKMLQEIYGSNLRAPNNKEPLAHFQVIFKPDGLVEVSPWQGYR